MVFDIPALESLCIFGKQQLSPLCNFIELLDVKLQAKLSKLLFLMSRYVIYSYKVRLV